MSQKNPIDIVHESRIKRTMKNLEKNFFVPYYADDVEQVKAILNDIVDKNATLASGGSQTLKESGLYDYIKENFNILEPSDYKDREDYYKNTIGVDHYMASANAISESGYIINVDGMGNRVASTIYGPKSVIIIAGVNKIVKTVEDAFERIKYIAAPANNIRLGTNNPCTKAGVCADCNLESRICSNYVILGSQMDKNRTKVILINKSLGY